MSGPLKRAGSKCLPPGHVSPVGAVRWLGGGGGMICGGEQRVEDLEKVAHD